MIIADLWARLNVLLPEPQCRTFGDEYDLVVWDDERSQPTESELESVTQEQIDNNNPMVKMNNARQILKDRKPGNTPVTWDDLNILLNALGL